MSGQARKASLFGLALVLAGVGLWAIRGAAPPVAPEKKDEGPHHRAALGKVIDFKGWDDPKVTLVEALGHLSDKCDVSFDVNDRAFRAEMIHSVLKSAITEKEPLPPMSKTTLAAILKRILQRVPTPSGATYLIRRDGIEI